MKVGKKTIILGIILLLSSFIVPTMNTQAKKPNNIVFSYETAFVNFVGVDEISVDIYGVTHYVNMELDFVIATEDCPLQGSVTQTITSYVKPGQLGLGIWYNSFEGTYNGEDASFEGWTATYQAVGYGYYLGQGALCGYLIKYMIDGTSGVGISTVELVRRNMKKNIDFEFIYDEIGDPAAISVDADGIWHLEDTPHYGHITYASKKYLSGDVYFENELYLFDNLLEPTTFNGIGQGLFEFDGLYKRRAAGFTGTLYFLIDDFIITGLLLATGTGKLAGCLITGFVSSVIGGSTDVQMSIYRLH